MSLQEWEWGQRPRLSSYTLSNVRGLPQASALGEDRLAEMDVVAHVLPFKANNYVVENLIDWSRPEADPMFVLTFPQRGMLSEANYAEMAAALETRDKKHIDETANAIRLRLNPHPAGQMELNVPRLADGTMLHGMQHKYRETCLFFPSQSQTCHAYCSFCFRWPQFVGMDGLKFAMRESEQLVQYLREHPEVTDVLFTGGDPMIMRAGVFATYVNALLEARIPTLRTIRIGTKALSYWPYKFLTDEDAGDMLDLFGRVTQAGVHLAIMAHFNHVTEMRTRACAEAIARVRATGAQIRTQSPLLAHINDDGDMWAAMWTEQVRRGCVPYYMFVVRDTGAQHYFGVPLVRAHGIFTQAYRQVSGLARTVRGPSMSATPGKVAVDGIVDVAGRRAMALRFLQGRDPAWVGRPFYAEYDEAATWLDGLRPLGGGEFFFEARLREMRAAR